MAQMILQHKHSTISASPHFPKKSTNVIMVLGVWQVMI